MGGSHPKEQIMKTSFTLLISCLLSILLSSAAISGSEPSSSINIADVKAVPGEEVVIPITVEGFDEVNVIQIFLYFNNSVARCLSVDNLHPDISNAMTNITDSLFMLSWYNISRSASISDGGKLLDLRFSFCTDATACEKYGSHTDLIFIPSHTFINGPAPDFDNIPLKHNHGSLSARDISMVYLEVDVEGKGKVMVDGKAYSGPVPADAGSTFSLDAVPEGDWVFEGWSGAVSGSKSSVNILMDGDRNVSARFVESEPEKFQVSTSVVPADKGTTRGAGTYEDGQQASVEAKPVSGYEFLHWKEGSNVVSESLEYTFTVKKNRNLVAHFQEVEAPKPESVAVTFNLYDQEGEGLTGASITFDGNTNSRGSYHFEGVLPGTYDYKVVKTGYHSKTGKIEVKEGDVTKDIFLTEKYYTVTFEVADGNGVILAQLGDKSIVSGEKVQEGRDVGFTADPADGYSVKEWRINGKIVSGNTNVSLVVKDLDKNINVTIGFVPPDYRLRTVADPGEGGSVKRVPNRTRYQAGAEVEVKATAASGYVFLHWRGSDGKIRSTDCSYIHTVAPHNETLTAVFEIADYRVRTTSNPAVGGVLSGSGTYAHGESVTLEASAHEGYYFVNWTEEGQEVSTDATYRFVADQDRSLEANFGVMSYAVDFDVDGEGGRLEARTDGGLIASGDEIDHGEAIFFKALPDAHYRIDSWTVNGETLDGQTEDTLVIESVDADVHVGVSFVPAEYKLILNVQPSDAGRASVNPDRSHFRAGDEVLTEADASTGYDFVHWLSQGEKVESTESSFAFTMPGEDVELTAVFELRTYRIDAMVSSDRGGDVSGQGEWAHGESVTLEASAHEGYYFVNWTEEGQEVSTDATYRFVADQDRSLEANFAKLTWQLSFCVQCTDGNDIPDAVVTLDGETFRKGQYEFDGLLPGNYNYIIRREGFAPQEGSVSLNGGDVVKSVGLEPEPFEMKMYPNPASEHVWLEFNIEDNSHVTLVLYNMEGRVVRKEQINQSGNVRARIDVYNLTPGIYMLTLQGDRVYPVQRLMIR